MEKASKLNHAMRRGKRRIKSKHNFTMVIQVDRVPSILARRGLGTGSRIHFTTWWGEETTSDVALRGRSRCALAATGNTPNSSTHFETSEYMRIV
jgi:hypothetical protein